MLINRTRLARAVVSTVFALSLLLGTQAVTPSAFADCSQPGGTGCKSSTAKTAGTLERSVDDTSGQTELTLDLPQLRILFELLGVLV